MHGGGGHVLARDIRDIPSIDVKAIYSLAINGFVAGEEVIDFHAGIGVLVEEYRVVDLVIDGRLIASAGEFFVVVRIGREAEGVSARIDLVSGPAIFVEIIAVVGS